MGSCRGGGQGFFEDKVADARVRGEPLPKKKDAAEEYQDFMKAIASDVKEVELRQEEEAANEAADKADREAFEQRCVAVGPLCLKPSGVCFFYGKMMMIMGRDRPDHRSAGRSARRTGCRQ
jgi:hypothetical protein